MKEEGKTRRQQLKKYEILGAKQFQKVVLKVEQIKFLALKKICPNFIRYYDKYCDWLQKRAIKKAKTDEEIENIKTNVKFSKMAMRKEWNTEKNRNYHMDSKRPTELINYLEWNKAVHKKGLIKNGILIPLFIAGVVFHVPGAIALLVLESISAIINFECINIQNYNLCQARKILPRLQKREDKIIAEDIENYGEAAEVIHKSVEESESIPSFDDILAKIENPNQLEQMKALLLREQAKRQAQRSAVNKEQVQKKIGGK